MRPNRKVVNPFEPRSTNEVKNNEGYYRFDATAAAKRVGIQYRDARIKVAGKKIQGRMKAAKQCGIFIGQLSNFEIGQENFDLNTLIRLAHAYGCEIKLVPNPKLKNELFTTPDNPNTITYATKKPDKRRIKKEEIFPKV